MDYAKFSMPMTLFMSSSLLNKLSLTSELSSLNSAKNIGSMCSLVGPLSIMGQSDNRFSATALLTY